MGKEKSVATHLNAYYRNKGETMPSNLKLLLFNYNIQGVSYRKFVDDIVLGPEDDDDKGNIDGDEEEEKEVVRFILDPDNAYVLGKYGHSKIDVIGANNLVVNGHVITEDNISLLLK